MEIIHYHKPFSKNYNRPVVHFLFLLTVLSYKWNFGHLFSHYDREFDMETDVSVHFHYVAKRCLITKKMTLPNEN